MTAAATPAATPAATFAPAFAAAVPAGTVQALGYVGLSVSDMPAWLRFASDILGVQAVPRNDGAVDLRLDGQASRIRLLPGGSDDVAYMGWECADATALQALARALNGAGVPALPAGADLLHDRGVAGLVQFNDPDGVACEAFYGPLQRSDSPFVSPLGVRFVTGAQGLGHAVLTVADAVRAQDFYTRLLGMRVSDHIHTEVVPGRPVSIHFMRCNSRHHSLAVTCMPLRQRLQHLMLELQCIDDVGRAMDRCIDAGHHLSLTLGRHSNDDMLSFYVMTPSGFDIEVGWGALAVDEATWRVKTHHTNSAWGHRFQRPPRKALPAVSSALSPAARMPQNAHGDAE